MGRWVVVAKGEVRVRRVPVTYDEDTNMCWTPQRPEFACVTNSVSLLMPYMEPYFVRSVAVALPDLEKEQAVEVRAYLGQETQHHVQHRQFNKLLTQRYTKLRFVERLAERTYGWLERKRSATFSLAFAAASEAIAYSIARWTAGREFELFNGADPAVSSLYMWHLAEEVEHKSVVFDVYKEVDSSRLRYVFAMICSIVLLAFFVCVGTTLMLIAEKRFFRPVAWGRLLKWVVTFAFELLPTLALSLTKNFHPRQLADPSTFGLWLDNFDRANEFGVKGVKHSGNTEAIYNKQG